jgi:uncharacterized membrane protein (DUF485 family)
MISEQIMATIDAIAERLGVAAETVYPMLLKQAEVFGAAYHVTLWILGVSMFLLIASAIWMGVAFHNDTDTLPLTIAAFMIIGIVVLVAALIAGIDLKEYLTSVYNPDMWVVEYVAKLLV